MSSSPITHENDHRERRRRRRLDPSSTYVRTVAVVGGTHGNEANGVTLAKYLLATPAEGRRSSFKTQVVLANARAIEANVRYTATDLNRCFALNDLRRPPTNYEEARAQELDALLGPKESDDPAVDFMFDLHNTTADTGFALIFAEDDAFAHQIGAYLSMLDSDVRLCHRQQNVDDWPQLSTVSRSGMTFEVGPAKWGALNAELYVRSLRLIRAGLDYIEAHNTALGNGIAKAERRIVSIPLHQRIKTIDYPRHENGDLIAMVHPRLQDADFHELKEGSPIFLDLDGATTRTFRKSDYDIDAEVSVFPYFINEAAYYEKEAAMVLARRTAPADISVLLVENTATINKQQGRSSAL
eukprot:g238.t1